MFVVITWVSIGCAWWLIIKGWFFAKAAEEIMAEVNQSQRLEFVEDPRPAILRVQLRNLNHVLLLICIAELSNRYGGTT